MNKLQLDGPASVIDYTKPPKSVLDKLSKSKKKPEKKDNKKD